MSETPHPAEGARGGLGLSTLVAAGICVGMLSIAVLVPPRQGEAAVTGGLVDRDGWSRVGSLERQELSVDIVLRDGERRYTVRRDGSIVAERITADELLQGWGIDAGSLQAEDDAPGAMMMVDPDAAALLDR